MKNSWMNSTYLDSLINSVFVKCFFSGLLKKGCLPLKNICVGCWLPVLSWIPCSDGSVLLGCSCHPSGVGPTECPPVGNLASVMTLTLACAHVCPASQAGPVTTVLMDTGIWSLAESQPCVVTPGPRSAAAVTRQKLSTSYGVRMRHSGETCFLNM